MPTVIFGSSCNWVLSKSRVLPLFHTGMKIATSIAILLFDEGPRPFICYYIIVFRAHIYQKTKNKNMPSVDFCRSCNSVLPKSRILPLFHIGNKIVTSIAILLLDEGPRHFICCYINVFRAHIYQKN